MSVSTNPTKQIPFPDLEIAYIDAIRAENDARTTFQCGFSDTTLIAKMIELFTKTFPFRPLENAPYFQKIAERYSQSLSLPTASSSYLKPMFLAEIVHQYQEATKTEGNVLAVMQKSVFALVNHNEKTHSILFYLFHLLTFIKYLQLNFCVNALCKNIFQSLENDRRLSLVQPAALTDISGHYNLPIIIGTPTTISTQPLCPREYGPHHSITE